MRIVETPIVDGKPQRADKIEYYSNEYPTDNNTVIGEYTGDIPESQLPSYKGEYPPGSAKTPQVYSKYRFMVALGDAALLAIMQSTDPVVQLMDRKFNAAEVIDMNESQTQEAINYLYLNGILTEVDRDRVIWGE